MYTSGNSGKWASFPSGKQGKSPSGVGSVGMVLPVPSQLQALPGAKLPEETYGGALAPRKKADLIYFTSLFSDTVLTIS